ncbi:MAG: serine hydroxymethyltransferase [Planctomycetes bacterium]|nr:serine hydroxymethyltransferase [Planctomycetota bacterium]
MGTEFLDEFERVAVEGLKELYGSEWADCRIQSGTLANVAVELGTTRPGDTIMSISLSAGSHTSHTSIGFPVFYGLNIVDIPFDDENVNVDLDRLESLLKEQEPKPKLLILGGSLFLFRFPVKEVRALLDRYSPETVLLFDAAHVDGLIVGGAYPNPLLDGAQIISGSTYKTFGGPPGGFVVGNGEEIYKKVKRAIYPGITTSYHFNRIGALAVTCLNLLKHATTYAPQIVKNAQALGAALDARGVNIVGRDLGYTQTHQVLIYMSEGDDMRSKEAGALLADANIITSPQLMPIEDRKDVRNPRGIRIGTQELTRLGMKEKEMQVAADFIADVLIDKKAPSEIAPQVIAERNASRNFERASSTALLRVAEGIWVTKKDRPWLLRLQELEAQGRIGAGQERPQADQPPIRAVRLQENGPRRRLNDERPRRRAAPGRLLCDLLEARGVGHPLTGDRPAAAVDVLQGQVTP